MWWSCMVGVIVLHMADHMTVCEVTIITMLCKLCCVLC